MITDKEKVNLLIMACKNMRHAQRKYMQNRGNDEIGRQVAKAAEEMDALLNDLAKYETITVGRLITELIKIVEDNPEVSDFPVFTESDPDGEYTYKLPSTDQFRGNGLGFRIENNTFIFCPWDSVDADD